MDDIYLQANMEVDRRAGSPYKKPIGFFKIGFCIIAESNPLGQHKCMILQQVFEASMISPEVKEL